MILSDRRFALANLFVQKIKFLAVKSKFKDCLKPFDVADIRVSDKLFQKGMVWKTNGWCAAHVDGVQHM